MSWPAPVRRRARRILTELAELEIEGLPLGLARKARELLPELRERGTPSRSNFKIARRASLDKGETAAARRRRVYAAVMSRDATCTAPWFHGLSCSGAPELDHQWGRGKAAETVGNCRILCTRHHRMKTDGMPSRIAWLEDFRRHAARHGYGEEVAKAERAIALERGQHPTRAIP